MVLTPIFRLEQTLENLMVHIHAPMAKISSIDVCIEEEIFYFEAEPYYLKFNLPGSILDEDDYNIIFEDDDIVITLKKADHVMFKDLNLITKLLIQSDCKLLYNKPLIQIINEDNVENGDEEKSIKLEWFDTTDRHTLELEENVFSESDVVICPPLYGFGCSRSGLFRVESDLSHAVHLPNPDQVNIDHRFKLKEQDEDEKFSNEHYLADFFEPTMWQSMVSVKMPWLSDNDDSEGPELTKEQRHRLLVLSSRQLPLRSKSALNEASLYLGLLDLMLAYAYDYRVREGEPMTECGWNIVTLSSTLSWLQVFHFLPDVMRSFYRRSLTYPLVRNWHFSDTIVKDVTALLRNEKVKEWCLQILLEIRDILINYPGYYVFVELYINDYIVWIQTHCSDTHLNDLGRHLTEFKFDKSSIGFSLDELEKIGHDCIEQEKVQLSLDQLTLSGHVKS